MSRTTLRWQQRLRAAQIKAGSLLGPSVSWARDVDRGVLLAKASGRFEVYAFDASWRPARLRRITDRPHGTTGCVISRDGTDVFWFDDRAGNEVGHWHRQPFDGGEETILRAAATIVDDPRRRGCARHACGDANHPPQSARPMQVL
jgi:hypothetical protein